MKRLIPVAGAVLLLLGLSAGSAVAANPANIDQQNGTDSVANIAGQTFAQTITVGKAGKFSSVDLWLGGAGSVTVDITAVDGSDHPTGSSLASGSGTSSATAGWVNFAFASPISVTVGQRYAIEFTTGGSGPFAYATAANAYSGGNMYFAGNAAGPWTAGSTIQEPVTDLAFRTYVDPNGNPIPKPTSTVDSVQSSGSGIALLVPVGLAACCGLMLLVVRRRRQRVF
jgi:hypothetical protein